MATIEERLAKLEQKFDIVADQPLYITPPPGWYPSGPSWGNCTANVGGLCGAVAVIKSQAVNTDEFGLWAGRCQKHVNAPRHKTEYKVDISKWDILIRPHSVICTARSSGIKCGKAAIIRAKSFTAAETHGLLAARCPEHIAILINTDMSADLVIAALKDVAIETKAASDKQLQALTSEIAALKTSNSSLTETLRITDERLHTAKDDSVCYKAARDELRAQLEDKLTPSANRECTANVRNGSGVYTGQCKRPAVVVYTDESSYRCVDHIAVLPGMCGDVVVNPAELTLNERSLVERWLIQYGNGQGNTDTDPVVEEILHRLLAIK